MNSKRALWFRTLLCLSLTIGFSVHAQKTTITSGGWFVRGTGTDLTKETLVIPLYDQQGVLNAPSLTNLYHQFVGGVTNLYHINSTNNASQNILTNRFLITNAVAACGSRYGGSPLYLGQTYEFGAYAGNWYTSNYYEAMIITLVNRTNGSLFATYLCDLSAPQITSDWNNLVTNGLSRIFAVPGLTTIFTLAPQSGSAWGLTNLGAMLLAHVAGSTATNYEYTFWVLGQSGTNWMTLSDNDQGFYNPLYTLDFDPVPVNQPAFLRQPQFQGQPLPPAYDGQSLTELLAVKAVVTNAVNPAATNWTDLDDSPELRDSPILDEFVTNMNFNALELAAYVFNQVQLCDAVAYSSNTNNQTDVSVNLGGINRSALDTYLEGQGSPAEQCALLVYFLRKTGMPAAYIYPPTDSVQMLDTRLSAILQMQLHGAVQTNGNVYTTNSLISVNYPWVAAYVNGQWVHLFPWIKNTEVTEGLNLYDYLDLPYNNGSKWVNQYITGDTNIFSLSAESDVPSVLFPAFVQHSLLVNAPGISQDDLGDQVVNRPMEYNQWSDFPTPFAVTNGSVSTVRNLTTITNIFPGWTNIWDTVSVQVYSTVHSNLSLFTGDLRMADLQDRKFLVLQQTNGASNFTLTLSLAPYRPTGTNVMAFTNDSSLLNQETLTMTLASTDDPIEIVFTNKRHRTEPSGVTNSANSYLSVFEDLQTVSTKSIRLGDVAALCLHSGRVAQPMLNQWAQEYWTMQQNVKANPALTNTLSSAITQGTLPYLMGMSYFERVTSFRPTLTELHKVTYGSEIGMGLSVIAAQRTTNGTLIKPLNLVHPRVDMAEYVLTGFGNSTLRPDEGFDLGQMLDSCIRVYTCQISAEEHKTIEDFYGQYGAISSVRLLLQAQRTNQPGMTNVTWENYASLNHFASYDSAMWSSVTNALANNQVANAYITLKPITNTVAGYTGMGCLIFAQNSFAALISGNLLPANGGWGDDLTEPIYNPPDYNDISLTYNTSSDDNWSVSYSTPTVSAPAPLAETISTWNEPANYNNLAAGALTYGGADVAQQNAFDAASFDLGYTGTGAAAATFEDAVNNGGDYDVHIGTEYAQLAGTVADPVNAVTGEFYIESTDLKLAGPMPVFVQRNYSSQDVDLGDTPFGYGWRPAYTPYLRILTNNVIYAAEMDGTVVAYRHPVAGTNFWQPLPSDNPQLNNRSSSGIGSSANLFNNFITTNTLGGTTNYVLTGADGSVRQFLWTSFPITGTNTFNRARPYLQNWAGANGNSYMFTFQTDSSQPDYGQLLRVQSSNGNFFGFDYDVFAHIVDAYTGDGRYLHYDYDEHGDLVTVTFPDDSQINYVYQHTTIVTNSTTNIVSTHLIVQEQKPEGRVLANTYDSLRRVILQAATVGTGLDLVTNATFLYVNNCTNLTNSVLTGTNYIADVFGRTNMYVYTNNLITSIQDALGQTITQVWFSNTNDTGYYPSSLKSSTDKRGLTTSYQYSPAGNLAQVTLTGNLTGSGLTNETAVYSFTYTSNNLISTATDPTANQSAYYYTNSAYPFLPTAIVKSAGGTPVSTNQYFYTSATQMVTNGAVFTNSSFGLMQRSVRGSVETSDFAYNGAGFPTQRTNYTGTADPAVVTSFFYDERGYLIQQTDAAGRSQLLTYDAMGRKTGTEEYEAGADIPEGFTYYYYNGNGEVNWTQGSRYNPVDYVWYDYDGAGRKTTEIRWLSQANATGTGVQAAANPYATTSFAYDAYNDLIQATDPLGNYPVKQYDSLARLTNDAAYSAAGIPLATNQYGYEPGGLVSRTVNPLGGVMTRQYDSLGKLIGQSNPDGSTNSWQYYLDGRLHLEFLDNGNYWETIYNDAQLLVTRNFHDGASILATTVQQSDARGNVVQSKDAGHNVFTTVFDGLNRVKAAIGPPITNVVLTFSIANADFIYLTNVICQAWTNYYDAAGLATTNVNALGEASVTFSDALGRTTQAEIFSAAGALVRQRSLVYSADHNSVTVIDGSGATAITNTTWTDTEGHTVLSIAYPAANATEFTLNQYDLDGNLIVSQHDSSIGGVNTTWTTNGFAYDGLNRLTGKVDRDGAPTTYAYDPMGDLTNRTMPFGLQWQATYSNAGQKLWEQNASTGNATRTTTYTYYASGSPFAGLLATKTDGRGVTCTYSYDNWLHDATNVCTGLLSEENLTTVRQYEPRGYVTNYAEWFASTNTGPATSVQRTFDPYGQVATEAVSDGAFAYNAFQTWDATGRRSQLNVGNASYGYGWQADGSLTNASNPTGSGTYTYDTAGLLTKRQAGNRLTSITARDGEGRPLAITNTLNTVPELGETLSWSGDGLLAAHTLARPDFADNRSYSYANLSRRVTREQLNINASTTWTNSFVYDRGAAGGPGALTTAGPTAATFGLWWSGLPDAFSRVNTETNNAIGFLAYGFVNGQSTLTAWLDNQPIQIMDVGTNNMQWRTFLELSQGPHQLKVSALHPSGFYTAWATNTFTNSIPYEVTADTFDGSGNITNRIWHNASGVVNRTQSLSYDAKGRLRQVTELNTNNYGFTWSATYDGLDRRLATTTVLVSNGVPSVVPPQVLNSYYDPQVEFLELGVLLSSAPQVEFLEAGTSPSVQAVWKLYGPDLNGRYGGLNGAGGLEGVSPYQNTFNPVISDARGNVLAEVTNGVASWTLARPTGYGAVPGYRPVAYGNGVDLAQSCVFRGREVDVTGYHHFGRRDYDPVSGQWLSYDPAWNERDPNGQSYCGGDPINRFDADGRLGKDIGPSLWDRYQNSQQGDAVDNYNQTQAQMGRFEAGMEVGDQSGGLTFSSMVDMIPVVGGLKMWVELGTGFDLVTGQHINSSDWTQVAMIGLNLLPVALEAAPEEAAIEAEVNIPFYGVGQVTSEGTADAYQFAQLRAYYGSLESASAAEETASITTPYAVEAQSASAEAQAALSQAQNGATLYRTGQLGTSMTGESQYWSLQNPLLNPNYAAEMGMPGVTPDFIMTGTLNPGASVIANEAPGLGANLGGKIQIVTQPGGVGNLGFHMP